MPINDYLLAIVAYYCWNIVMLVVMLVIYSIAIIGQLVMNLILAIVTEF